MMDMKKLCWFLPRIIFRKPKFGGILQAFAFLWFAGAALYIYNNGYGMTNTIKKRIQRLEGPTSELRCSFSIDFRIKESSQFPGSYVGLVKDGDQQFRHYQFTNVLHGDTGRILNILVPVVQPSSSSRTDTNRTFAYVPRSQRYSMGPKAQLFDGTVQKPEIDKAVLYSPLPYNHKFEGDDNLDILELSLSYQYPPNNCIKVDRIRGSGKLEWGRRHPLDIHQFDWNKRDRLQTLAMRLKYLYSVPIDLLTYPLQYFALCMMTPMGGM